MRPPPDTVDAAVGRVGPQRLASSTALRLDHRPGGQALDHQPTSTDRTLRSPLCVRRDKISALYRRTIGGGRVRTSLVNITKDMGDAVGVSSLHRFAFAIGSLVGRVAGMDPATMMQLHPVRNGTA
jgi:hypothetical protein